jgi:hypothetical protein
MCRQRFGGMVDSDHADRHAPRRIGNLSAEHNIGWTTALIIPQVQTLGNGSNGDIQQ